AAGGRSRACVRPGGLKNRGGGCYGSPHVSPYAIPLGDCGRWNIQKETTRIHSRNKNCGKNAIEASARIPTTTPSHPAHVGQTAPHMNASEVAMITTPTPPRPWRA